MLFIDIPYNDMNGGNKSVDGVKSPETNYPKDAVYMTGRQTAASEHSLQTIALRETSMNI